MNSIKIARALFILATTLVNYQLLSTHRAQAATVPGVPTGPSTGCGDAHISTAIGCVPFGSMAELVEFFLRWAFGIGGGVALIFIIYASFLLISSSGDPKKVQAGRELLGSAIAGVVFLVFSVFVLRIVGVDILGLTFGG